MKHLACLLAIFCLTSCDYINKKKVNSQDIINDELQTFNWSEVDTYPSFNSCDKYESKNEHKHCFITTLTNHIKTELGKNTIIVTHDIQDTIQLKFQISELGDIEMLNIKSDLKTREAIPNIDSLLVESLNGLPKVFPAIKRGQQVKTEFTLPIIIAVN